MTWGRLPPGSVVIWTAVVLVGVLGGVWACRKSGWRTGLLLTGVPVVLVPVAAWGASFLAFRTGRYPLVQYNADDAGQTWFSSWGSIWLVLLLPLLVACPVSLVLAVRAGKRGGSGAGGWALVLLSCVVSLAALFQNFPDV